MKTFLAVFTGSFADRSEWTALDEATRKQREGAGMAAWGKWMADHQSDLADEGGPLGKTRKATREGVKDISNNMGGYVKVRAESHEAAMKMFENHPSFMLFPGDGVEVMEVMPIPGH